MVTFPYERNILKSYVKQHKQNNYIKARFKKKNLPNTFALLMKTFRNPEITQLDEKCYRPIKRFENHFVKNIFF